MKKNRESGVAVSSPTLSNFSNLPLAAERFREILTARSERIRSAARGILLKPLSHFPICRMLNVFATPTATATYQPTLLEAIAPRLKFYHVEKFDRSDMVALAEGVACMNDEKPIRRFVLRGVNEPVKKHPATCDYRRNKDGRVRSIALKNSLHWSPSGHGKSKPSCGYVSQISTCVNAHCLRAVRHHCWGPSCPICFMDNASRRASEIKQRKSAFDQFRERGCAGGSDECGTWQHVVFSPPQELSKNIIGSEEGYNLLLEWCRDMAESLGYTAGVQFFHPWRQDGEDLSENAILTGNTGDSLHWRVAPHFHLLAFGPDVTGLTKANFENSGWVVKVIQSDLDDVAFMGCAEYILSHVGIGQPDGDRRKAVRTFRLFGGLSTSRLSKVYSVKESEEVLCPECESNLYPYPDVLMQNGELAVLPVQQKIRTDWYVPRSARSNVVGLLQHHRDDARAFLDDLVEQGVAVTVVTNPKPPPIISRDAGSSTPPPTVPRASFLGTAHGSDGGGGKSRTPNLRKNNRIR